MKIIVLLFLLFPSICFSSTLNENQKYLLDLARYHGSVIGYPETVQSILLQETVAGKFQHSGKYNLVVLDDGKYVGFVSRANVFSHYRQLLKDFSED